MHCAASACLRWSDPPSPSHPEPPVAATSGCCCSQLLKTFLAARQAYLTQCLTSLVGIGDADPASLAAVLSDLAGHICSTVAQCGELFLPLPGVASTPLLLHMLQQQQDAGAGAKVLLEPGENRAAVWAMHLVAAEARLADLSPGGVALECSQWLEGVARQLRLLGGSLLGVCAGGADLLAVERTVLAGLEAWRCCPWGQREGGASPMAWPDVCLWVLAQPCALWQLLLDELFLERARQLLAAGFDAAVDETAALIDAALADTAALGLAAPSAQPLERAVPQPDELAQKAGKRRRLESGLVAGASAIVGGASSWLDWADSAVGMLDQRLEAALATVLDICGPQAVSAGSGSRARALQPFAQQRCADAGKRVAALLRERFEALQRHLGDAGDATAPTMHQALLLGRAALGVASRSQQMPRILGSPELWATASMASTSDQRVVVPAPQLDSVQQQCRELAEAAYRLWAAWAAARLGAQLAKAWAADVALAADALLRAWEETVVLCSGDAADGGGGTRFMLPVAPSPAAAAAALGACQEADRAGGHTIDGPALQQLGHELAGAVAVAAREAATAPSLSEKGVLQLLFDLRLLLELLGSEAG